MRFLTGLNILLAHPSLFRKQHNIIEHCALLPVALRWYRVDFGRQGVHLGYKMHHSTRFAYERRMKEYVMPTHAPKKEMPAMMSIKTSDPRAAAPF